MKARHVRIRTLLNTPGLSKKPRESIYKFEQRRHGRGKGVNGWFKLEDSPCVEPAQR